MDGSSSRLNLREIAARIEGYRRLQVRTIERAREHRFKGYTLEDLGLKIREPIPLAEGWGNPHVNLILPLLWINGGNAPFHLAIDVSFPPSPNSVGKFDMTVQLLRFQPARSRIR